MRQLAASTVARIASLPLPGNVRELENMLHRALALSDGDALELAEAATAIGSSRVGESIANSPAAKTLPSLPNDLQAYLDEKERQILVRALRDTGFNRTLAARLLGLTLRQIRYRIARLKIDAPDIHGEHLDG